MLLARLRTGCSRRAAAHWPVRWRTPRPLLADTGTSVHVRSLNTRPAAASSVQAADPSGKPAKRAKQPLDYTALAACCAELQSWVPAKVEEVTRKAHWLQVDRIACSAMRPTDPRPHHHPACRRLCSQTSTRWPCACAPLSIRDGCTCPGTPQLHGCAWGALPCEAPRPRPSPLLKWRVGGHGRAVPARPSPIVAAGPTHVRTAYILQRPRCLQCRSDSSSVELVGCCSHSGAVARSLRLAGQGTSRAPRPACMQVDRALKGLVMTDVCMPQPWERVAQLSFGVRPVRTPPPPYQHAGTVPAAAVRPHVGLCSPAEGSLLAWDV